jgi:heat shock protein HslJ
LILLEEQNRENMKRYILILLILPLLLSACAGQSTEEPSASILGDWKLIQYGPVNAPIAAVEDVGAGLTFNEDGTITGSSGCNGLGGDYTVEGDQITFGEFVSTLMACEDPIMVQEDVAHQVMTGTASYEMEGDTLTITNNENALVFRRGSYATAEPEDFASLLGAWKLTSFGSGGTLTSALPDVQAGLTFNEDGTITGTSGCNEFGGNYHVEGNRIIFSEVVSTLILCDAPVMEQEEVVQQVLMETATYQIEGNAMTITKEDRALVLMR